MPRKSGRLDGVAGSMVEYVICKTIPNKSLRTTRITSDIFSLENLIFNKYWCVIVDNSEL
jgi:hypothetical protein